jgi:hypothetical protein
VCKPLSLWPKSRTSSKDHTRLRCTTSLATMHTTALSIGASNFGCSLSIGASHKRGVRAVLFPDHVDLRLAKQTFRHTAASPAPDSTIINQIRSSSLFRSIRTPSDKVLAHDTYHSFETSLHVLPVGVDLFLDIAPNRYTKFHVCKS